jgi:calcineurin-like phosphoesterase family protein
MALPGIYNTFAEKWDGQTVWIYSDPHFSDIDLECGIKDRPSDDEQIRRINAKCGRKDTLIILGDVGNINCVRRLRAAHKVLIMGNHDAGRTNYERVTKILTFDKNQCSKEQLKNALTLKYPGWKIDISEEHNDFHSPFDYWAVKLDNCLFDEVYEGALIVGEKLILSHEPVDIPWLYNIHGHDHAGAKRPNHMNVCSDVIGYEPINFNQFLKAGHMSKIQTIHRETIDKATDRKKKRGGKIGLMKTNNLI